jgi:glutathione synthetase
MIDRYVVGGFYRVHTARGHRREPERARHAFKPLAFETGCTLPDAQLGARRAAQPLLCLWRGGARHGAETVMAQRYIPEIKDGDKRILVIDGVAVPFSLARIPAPGETRGNLAAGGSGVARPLTARDAEIAAALGPVLKEAGIFLAGLDVIGDWLTEVNVTSPTCFREITDQTGFNVAGMFMDALERKVAG